MESLITSESFFKVVDQLRSECFFESQGERNSTRDPGGFMRTSNCCPPCIAPLSSLVQQVVRVILHIFQKRSNAEVESDH